jgi:hypothetical protein
MASRNMDSRNIKSRNMEGPEGKKEKDVSGATLPPSSGDKPLKRKSATPTPL